MKSKIIQNSLLLFIDIMRLVAYDRERLVDQNHVLQQLRLLVKYHSTNVNVLVYLHGKYGIDCYKMAFVQMIIFQV